MRLKLALFILLIFPAALSRSQTHPVSDSALTLQPDAGIKAFGSISEARAVLQSALNERDFTSCRQAALYLADKLYSKGEYEEALGFQEQAFAYRDSIRGEAGRADEIREEALGDYNRKRMHDSLSLAASERVRQINHMQEIEDQKFLGRTLGGGGLLMLLVGLVAFNGYRKKKNSIRIIESKNQELEVQKRLALEIKEVVAQKNREIVDSINYSARLQAAILPREKRLYELFPDSFLLYLPKDVVAGDFYWMMEKDSRIFLAVADCTGHGVPGAMVSVICSGALKKAVEESETNNPAEILEATSGYVVSAFEKGESEVKDGMDISFAVIDRESGMVQWAGANNPLWIIRAGSGQIDEIKASKRPVGKSVIDIPFVSHNLTLAKGDSIYLFSDGFADQFGGEKGKKLKTSGFRQLIEKDAECHMPEQGRALGSFFRNWQGDLEQVDDVCVLGLRF